MNPEDQKRLLDTQTGEWIGPYCPEDEQWIRERLEAAAVAACDTMVTCSSHRMTRMIYGDLSRDLP